MHQILILDPTERWRATLERQFAGRGCTVAYQKSWEEGQGHLDRVRPDLILMCMEPTPQDLAKLDQITRLIPGSEVVALVEQADMDTAIRLIQNGAAAWLDGACDAREIERTIWPILRYQRKLADIYLRPQGRPAAPPEERIVGRSSAIRDVLRAVALAAKSDATVLIEGESGTGKELVAKAIHRYSKRQIGLFRVVNCGAVPSTLWESELFGYEAGAFTGATHKRQGTLAQAQGGTLFLDEISTMPLEIQPKLLRVIQEGEFYRLGGKEPQQVDVRLIAATNQNLADMVAADRFRADLYHRLHVIRILLVPLRERREDIPELVDYLLQKIVAPQERPLPALTPQAMALLTEYDWPGNVRELENTLQEAVTLSRHQVLTVEDFVRLRGKTPTVVLPGWSDRLQEIERQHITYMLRYTRGRQTEASQRLGISRSTLTRKIRQLALARADRGPARKTIPHWWEPISWTEVERTTICRVLEETAYNHSQAARRLGISRSTLSRKLVRYGKDGKRKGYE